MKAKKNNYVEIISVRLINPQEESRIRDIFSEITTGRLTASGEPVDAEIYVSASVESDLAIHLYRNSELSPPTKTRLGLNLAEALRTFGLVNHSVWK